MPKILAIDDKMDNLTALSALLANLMPDCVVITAQSGPEGIEKAKYELPDAILLDVKMPEMDGFETCRRLMAGESTRHIPVIMITAIKTDFESRIEGLDCGALAFLAKPIDHSELVSQVKVALRIKKAEDGLRTEKDSLEAKVHQRTIELSNEITEHKLARELLNKHRIELETQNEELLRTQEERKITMRLMQLLNVPNKLHELIRSVTALLQDWSGCEAIGIRLHDGEDYPYFETRGFPAEFIQKETNLCAYDLQGQILRDSEGHPLLECMCGNVLCGRFDPKQPFFTARGSFWSNNTTALLASTTEADRQAHTRNRCNGEGYESVALIPLRTANKLFGLLQFNDPRPDRFTPTRIALLERLADSLAIALAQRQAERDLRESEKAAKRLAQENEMIGEIGRIISSTLNIEEVYERFAKKVQEIIPFDSLQINLVNTKDNTRTIRYRAGLQNEERKIGNVVPLAGSVTEQIVCTRSSHIVKATDREDLLRQYHGISHPIASGLQSRIGVPLISKDEIIGTLIFRSVKSGVYTDIDLNTAERVGTQIAGAIANAQLFLEHRQTEEALQDAEKRYRTLFEHAPDGLVIIDPATARLLEFNECAHQQLGYSREEFANLTIFDIEALETSEETRSRMAKVMSAGQGDFDTRQRTKQGGIKDIHVTARITEISGHSVYQSVWRDITEQKKMEEQLRQSQKMEGIGQLTGGIAHDFNNILATIMGYGEMALIKMAADDSQRSNIEHILEATGKAAHLTKDLLLFSRKQIAVKKPVYLDMIIGDMQKFLRRVIGEDIEFKVIFQEKEVPVLADRNHIEQVIMNLATNARDAMPRGGMLTITLERTEVDNELVAAHGYGKAGGYAVITFADTGKGMDEETRRRIFEPFFTTKEVGKGTGLGMAVVYGIIRQHDGYINVESEPGLGTTFKVYLPLIESAAHLEETATDMTYFAGSGETILLAEDDRALRELTSRILEKFGYKVIAAADGDEAVQKFREHQDSLQLLLLDMIMPKHNGKEAYDEIAKIKPGAKVIFLSGYAPDVVREKMTIEDAATVLSKPISARDLLKAVREVLDDN